MSTKLEQLLKDIDPSRTIDKVEQRLNSALASYQLEKNTVDSWEEIEPFLGRVFRKLENAALTIQGGFQGDINSDSSRAMWFLEKEYGSSRTVYDIMLNGTEGGIYSILRSLVRLMAEQYSQNEISSRVSDWWDTLSDNEKLELPEEYVRKFQDILPLHTREDNIRVKAYFFQVLVHHPRMIKRIRDQGHAY